MKEKRDIVVCLDGGNPDKFPEANIKSMCPTFSIIIPHYDIPYLLMRSPKSIPVSEDIQVIVVDDNSPDAALNDVRKGHKLLYQVALYIYVCWIWVTHKLIS